MARFISSLLVIAVMTLSGLLCAAPLQILMHDQDGKPLADAVVTLRGPAAVPPAALKADMDQRAQQFMPHVLAVRKGTQVKFPNSDNIRHQVYSFSAAKRFELRLYEGTPSDPVLFDKPGVVVLGCNIHDGMLGYVYVSDDPLFAVTDAQGRLSLNASAGVYRATLWHPQAPDMQPVDGGELKIGEGGLTRTLTLIVDAHASPLPAKPAPSTFRDAFNRAADETAQ